MPWYVVLIIALAGMALVLGMLVRVGLKGWRVVKHAAAVSGRITPLVDELGRRSDDVTLTVERLSADGRQLEASMARMQHSLARLQVVARAFNDALRPYLVVSGWLSGEREWGDLGV